MMAETPRSPRKSPPPELLTAAGWGHWTGDGRLSPAGHIASPRTRYKTMDSGSDGQLSPDRRKGRPSGTSLLDGEGADRTKGISPEQDSKRWSNRSMKSMVDYGTVPCGLPCGINDAEKKLWLAIYVKAREKLVTGAVDTVRVAVDNAVNEVTDKHSLEFRFGVRWSHSVKTSLAMRQDHRGSDVYA